MGAEILISLSVGAAVRLTVWWIERLGREVSLPPLFFAALCGSVVGSCLAGDVDLTRASLSATSLIVPPTVAFWRVRGRTTRRSGKDQGRRTG